MGLIVSLYAASRVIEEIFNKIDEHIEKDDLLMEYNMSALPNLYKQFVTLIEYLVIHFDQ